VIIAGNHPNLMDGVVLGVVSPRPVRFLVAADTMRGPAGVVARWLGAIPVDRSHHRETPFDLPCTSGGCPFHSSLHTFLGGLFVQGDTHHKTGQTSLNLLGPSLVPSLSVPGRFG
jgi:1-acyl-sn-glycerol-3-phosphate acyltransferase